MYDSQHHTSITTSTRCELSSSLKAATMAEPDDSTYTFTAGNRTYFISTSNSGVPQLQEGENRMSSLSRRACYKCGNVGHYAGMMDLWSRIEDEH
jgi:hypothetical protein